MSSWGFLGTFGGLAGLRGLQLNRSIYVSRYGAFKTVQVVIGVLTSLVQIIYIEQIANEAADFYIDEVTEEAIARHMKPPHVDRKVLVTDLTAEYLVFARLSIFIWVFLWGYLTYVIYSLAKWLEAGVRPGTDQIVVRLPPHAVELTHLEAGERVQYATPFLQGQESVIPVELR